MITLFKGHTCFDTECQIDFKDQKMLFPGPESYLKKIIKGSSFLEDKILFSLWITAWAQEISIKYIPAQQCQSRDMHLITDE